MSAQHGKTAHKSRAENLQLAVSCAHSFASAAGIGCMVTDADGHVVHEEGICCSRCGLCHQLGLSDQICSSSQYMGMSEAERFGGKYIYYCALGLTCFVSPIMGSEGGEAKITAGPVLMVDAEDYISCDVEDMYHPDAETLEQVRQEVNKLPQIAPRRVTELSTLLFMAAGFVNNLDQAYSMMEKQNADVIQGRINSYVMQLKDAEEEKQRYPMEKETELLRRVRAREIGEAHEMLSELAGSLFFSTGGAIPAINCRVREVLALLSRAAIEAGAETEMVLELAAEQQQKLDQAQTADQIITAFVRGAQSMIRCAAESDHWSSAIRSATLLIRQKASEKLTLHDAARHVGLSDSYFSRVFRKETGLNFIQYLNAQRIEKAKPLLRYTDEKLSDIALAVGFEDHSYFTRVFKECTGMLPSEYRSYRNRTKK